MDALDYYTDVRMEAYENGMAMNWIPCSQELPKEKGTYLVTVKNFGVTFSRFTGQKDNLYFDSNVIAWMPIPMPYKVN